MQKATERGESEFLQKIAYRTLNPTVRGRIRHPSLWLLFAILESLNSLDGVFTHSDLLDLCDEAGIERYENRIEDVGYLSKRLADFRRYQKTGGVSTH